MHITFIIWLPCNWILVWDEFFGFISKHASLDEAIAKANAVGIFMPKKSYRRFDTHREPIPQVEAMQKW